MWIQMLTNHYRTSVAGATRQEVNLRRIEYQEMVEFNRYSERSVTCKNCGINNKHIKTQELIVVNSFFEHAKIKSWDLPKNEERKHR